MEMEDGETATQFCDRVKVTIYDDLVTMSQNSSNLEVVVNNLAQSGVLDITKIILTGVRSAPHMSHDIRSVCANFSLNRSTINLPINAQGIDEQLDDYYELFQEFEKVETRELMYNPPTRRTGNKKGKLRKGRTLREFAAALANGELTEDLGEKDPEPDDDEASASETAAMSAMKSQISELTSTVAAFVNAQKQGGGGNQNSGNSGKTAAERKAARLKPYSGIVAGDFKQGSFDESLTCEYCVKKGHKQSKCARFAWDLTHDQLNAHAGPERIEYLKSKGYNSHQPAAGSFKIYPHGNGNGPSAKKSEGDVIADLEKQLADLKEKKKGGKSADKYAALIEAVTAAMDGESDSDDG